MLGKLVKYECKATAQIVLPTFLALFLFTFLGRFSLGHMIKTGSTTSVVNVRGIHIAGGGGDLWSNLSGLAMTLYVLAILAISVVVTIVIIQRFYKNLTGDEGYLMHTLPVKPGLLIWSKLIVASIWELLVGAGILLSVVILLWQPAIWSQVGPEFLEGWRMFTEVFKITPLWVTGMAIATLLSVFGNTLMIYASIAIGHTTKNHRVLGSVLAYFGLSTAMQVVITPLAGLLILPGITIKGDDMASVTAFVQMLFGRVTLLILILSVVMIVVYYFVTNYVFTKQLNLE